MQQVFVSQLLKSLLVLSTTTNTLLQNNSYETFLICYPDSYAMQQIKLLGYGQEKTELMI